MSTAKPNEPERAAEDGSMDTILASIRRILNEDEVAPAEPPPPPSPTRRPQRDDVLVLGESMMVPPEKIEPLAPAAGIPAPLPETQAASAQVGSPQASSPRTPATPFPTAPLPVAPIPAAPDRDSIEGLVAARTRAAATQSFDALHQALRETVPTSGNSPSLLRSGGPTLEDLVRDELRGLLSSWLDVHLPALVETLVRSEIEKLTRRS